MARLIKYSTTRPPSPAESKNPILIQWSFPSRCWIYIWPMVLPNTSTVAMVRPQDAVMTMSGNLLKLWKVTDLGDISLTRSFDSVLINYIITLVSMISFSNEFAFLLLLFLYTILRTVRIADFGVTESGVLTIVLVQGWLVTSASLSILWSANNCSMNLSHKFKICFKIQLRPIITAN